MEKGEVIREGNHCIPFYKRIDDGGWDQSYAVVRLCVIIKLSLGYAAESS